MRDDLVTPASVERRAPQALAADRLLVETWAASQSSTRTRIAYRQQGVRLLTRLGRPLAEATVEDLQGYIAGLGNLAPATISFAASAVRSLYAFGRVTGVLSNTPDAALRAQSVKDVLAQRTFNRSGARRTTLDKQDT